MRIFGAVRRSMLSLKNNYVAVMAVVMMLVVVLVVYWQDLSILVNEALQNEALSHIILVPILASFLIYRKKERVKVALAIESFRRKAETVTFSEITGIAVCLSAFLLYWYGSYTFYPLEYHVASLVIFIIGTTLILFNARTLIALIFPILFLFFLMPPPSPITLSAGAMLGNFSAEASYALLKTIGLPVTLSSEYGPPTLLVDNQGRSLEFAVDLPCSGIYSLVAFVMFAAFLAYIVRGSIIKKIVLFPLGFMMLAILNVLRISLIVFIAYSISQEIAMSIFHLFSGWILIFMGMLLLLVFAEKLLHLRIFGEIEKAPSCPKCDDTAKSNEFICSNCGSFLTKNRQISFPRKFWIKITALLLVSYLVALSLQAPTFAFAQGLTIANPNPEASTQSFPEITDYQLKFLYRDERFEKVAHQDASLIYAYISQNASKPSIYVFVGVASSITNLHSWEVCLVSWQTAQGYAALVNVLESRDIQIMKNPPIIARYFVFQHPAGYSQITLYWYQRALFKTGLTVEPRFTRISLVILTRDPNDSAKVEQQLVDMGQSITAYWEPLQAQSLVSLSIPTMQALLGFTLLFAAVAQTTQYTTKWRKKTTKLKIFEKMASPEEKLLYRTIKEMGGRTKEKTTQNIAVAFEKTTGKAMKPDKLIEKLYSLEKSGIIEADIMHIQDQTKLVWKP